MPANSRPSRTRAPVEPPPNPQWRRSPPRVGWITVVGADLVERRVHVVEVDAYAVRDFLPAPTP